MQELAGIIAGVGIIGFIYFVGYVAGKEAGWLEARMGKKRG